jgi:hypothetical protein
MNPGRSPVARSQLRVRDWTSSSAPGPLTSVRFCAMSPRIAGDVERDMVLFPEDSGGFHRHLTPPSAAPRRCCPSLLPAARSRARRLRADRLAPRGAIAIVFPLNLGCCGRNPRHRPPRGDVSGSECRCPGRSRFPDDREGPRCRGTRPLGIARAPAWGPIVPGREPGSRRMAVNAKREGAPHPPASSCSFRAGQVT